MDMLQPSLTYADVRQSLQNTQVTVKSQQSQLQKIKGGISTLVQAYQAELAATAAKSKTHEQTSTSRELSLPAGDPRSSLQDRDQTIAALRAQIEQLRQSQAPLVAKTQQLEAELAATRTSASMLQSLIDEQKSGYESLISELEARLLAQPAAAPPPVVSDDPLPRLQTRITEIETQLSEKEHAMQTDRNQFAQLLAEAEERARVQQQDLVESKEALQRSLSEYQNELHQHREKSSMEIAQLQTQLARAEAAAASAQHAPPAPVVDNSLLEKERQERAELEQQLRSTETQLLQATARVRKLEVAQKVQQTREAEHSAEGGSVLAQQLRDLQAELKQHVLREQALQKEKSDLELELEELKTICDEKTANEKKAVSQAHECRVRVEVLEAQLTQREQELTKLHWDLDGYRSQLTDEQSIAQVIARTQPAEAVRPAALVSAASVAAAPAAPALAGATGTDDDDEELMRSEAEALQRELAKIEREMSRITTEGGGSPKP